jgi:hypothetical protein
MNSCEVDLPLSRSISGLDETLKAVRNLLNIKRGDQGSSNLIQIKRKLRPVEEPSLSDESQPVTGSSILYREHKRRSLLGSKSESLLPTIKAPSLAPDPEHPKVIDIIPDQQSPPMS